MILGQKKNAGENQRSVLGFVVLIVAPINHHLWD
jgi:hypothetical protein